jgi:hypothetical protein
MPPITSKKTSTKSTKSTKSTLAKAAKATKATKSRLAAEKAISRNGCRQQVANDESEDPGRETGSLSEADSDSVSSDGATDNLEDMVGILDKGSPQLTSVSWISSRSRHDI